MALQPIEMQILVPKATEVSRIQQQRDNFAQNNQRMLSNEEQRNAEIRQEQVQTTEHVDNKKITRDENGKNKKKSSQDKGNAVNTENEKFEEKESLDPVRGHKLDLTL